MKNTDNQMAPHICKTVEEIDADIGKLLQDAQRLNTIREGIVDLYGGETELPPVPAAPLQHETPAPKIDSAALREIAKEVGASSGTVTSHKGRAPSAETVKLMAATRVAPEPFTSNSLAVSTGQPVPVIAKVLARWQMQGFLNRVSRGTFTRSKDFPAAAPTE